MTRTEQAPPPDTSATHARFRAQLFQWREVHPKAHIYVLLDQNHPVAPRDPLRLDALKSRPIKRHIEVVHRADFAHSADLLPQLLELYEAGERGYVDEPLLDLTLACASARCGSVNGAYVAAWLCSEREPAQLAAHIAGSGELFDLAQNKRRYVPLFEPHRFALLVDDPVADPFLQRWLKPFQHWMFMDVAGALRVSSPSSVDSVNKPAPSQAGLHRDQFAMQDRVGIARFVMLALDRSGIVLSRQPEREVDRAIYQAQTQGLRQTEDIIFHALNTFTLGPSWAEHCTAAALIRQVSDAGHGSELRLAELMRALPDETWDDIASASRRPFES